MYNAQLTIKRIQSLIKEKGYTQKYVLAECGINENTLKRMTDNKGISSFYLAKIADYLQCSVDYLLGRTDNPELSGESYYINGDNNGIQSNKGTVKVESSRKTDITEEFIQAFETLELSDKVDVMSFTMQKMKKED